jgi:predicted nuclease of restriction endonuclease-like (RecB) superfamily
LNFDSLAQDIGHIHQQTQAAAGRAVDQFLTLRSWLIGAWIVEYEQAGADRAAYGERLLASLAETLKAEGHKGLSLRNLKNFRQVTLTWPGLDIRQTLSAIFGLRTPEEIRQMLSANIEGGAPETSLLVLPVGGGFASLRQRAAELEPLEWQDQAWLQRLFTTLSFSHLLELSRIDEPQKRAFYELQCLKEGWVVRDLIRHRNSLLYERAGLSRDKDALMALTRQGQLLETPRTILRDPYVLEFLGLKEPETFQESELEQKLIDHLQQFLHELGRDFCFVDRQYRVTVGGRHHFLDLLFFHRGLRCLVAIDLKVGEFEPAFAGQMEFYLNYLAENVAHPDENPPIGLLLCSHKEHEMVHYATARIADSVFVSRYLTELPSEELLLRWMREERSFLEMLVESDDEE